MYPAPPLVSIVLPVYNQASLLGGAVQSVLAQTYRHFELIVLDDGSTDNPRRVVQTFADARIRFVSRPHQGLPRTLNAGWALAEGEYLTWTSADNELLPTMLEELVAVLERDPEAGAVYADYVQIDAAGRTLRRMSKGEYNVRERMNFGPAFLFRRAVVERVGLFDTTLQGIEDRDYSMRMALAAPVRWLPKELYRYRLHDNSMTGRYRRGVESAEAARQRFRQKWAHLDRRAWHAAPDGQALTRRPMWASPAAPVQQGFSPRGRSV
ncbi:MAG TPA: glycosyltransferase [Limnochordia bacterium]|nr:glycosyltransferase [Limnochordia bacterium]